MTGITLTILILTVPERIQVLHNLLIQLMPQCAGKPVEILYLGDNKARLIGDKRNQIIDMAQGTYAAFIDDDDSIAPNYIDSLLTGIESGADVITFEVYKTKNGKYENNQKFKRQHGKNHTSGRIHKMLPNHLCCWKLEIMKKLPFANVQLGEDWRWAEDMMKHYETEHHTDMLLYFYNFNTETTLSRRT